ncbi:unnamed protein product [Medioppia subpectinata]|uniref:Uncharacterized protein n=1 Tax=Medioppia subpectinata TaxID=1979941 RepID=A0A7R9KTX4_9ACAR|nr:unnamed protein product [Medioppia subpectinata]CAG2108624.1 unnamed protein product [Medioppia subpectinata]
MYSKPHTNAQSRAAPEEYKRNGGIECIPVEHYSKVGQTLPTSIAAEAVLALGITGNTEASQTLRLLAPLTLNWGSITTSGLSIAPIRQVPDG